MIFLLIIILIVVGLLGVVIHLSKVNVRKNKFNLARNSKAKRLLIEDSKRNAKDHPLD